MHMQAPAAHKDRDECLDRHTRTISDLCGCLKVMHIFLFCRVGWIPHYKVHSRRRADGRIAITVRLQYDDARVRSQALKGLLSCYPSLRKSLAGVPFRWDLTVSFQRSRSLKESRTHRS